jgi:hypothetical protein
MDQLDNSEIINLAHIQAIHETLDAIRHLGLIKLSDWAGEIGISSETLWLWREKGWLKIVNVGRLEFLTYRDLVDFLKKIEKEEFLPKNRKNL